MIEQYLQIGAVAVIFLFCAKEFFIYLKSRKQNGDEYKKENGTSKMILEQLELQNTNHLHGITEEMVIGFDKLNNKIRDSNKEIVILLTEIKTVLNIVRVNAWTGKPILSFIYKL